MIHEDDAAPIGRDPRPLANPAGLFRRYCSPTATPNYSKLASDTQISQTMRCYQYTPNIDLSSK
jgi:hypothetical protein